MAENWDLVGLTDIHSRLGKRIQSCEIIVWPDVVFDATGIHLQPNENQRKYVVPRKEAFDAFVRLWKQPSAHTLRFARKWGLLRINERPVESEEKTVWQEPLSTWQHFSRRAHAILNIASNLDGGALGLAEDWHALPDMRPHLNDETLSQLEGTLGMFRTWASRGSSWDPDRIPNLEEQRTLLMTEVAVWLKLGRTGFMLVPNKNKWELVIDYNFRIFGFLALQLAAAIARSDIYTCSGCGSPYPRERRLPKPGQANYCEECRSNKVALKDADRRRREKIAKAKVMHAAGKPNADIASALGTSPASVKRWLAKGR
jgi:hypothetical protein